MSTNDTSLVDVASRRIGGRHHTPLYRQQEPGAITIPPYTGTGWRDRRCLLQAHATFVLARIKHITGDRQAARDLIGQARELDDSPWPSMSRPSQRLFVAP